MFIVNLVMRWLHIFSVITAVGGTVFLRLVLVPALADFDSELRGRLLKSMAPKIRVLIHSAIGGLLLSGLYNTHLLWKTAVPPYGLIYTLKIILALAVILIAIFLTSSNPKRSAFQTNRKKWLAINLGLGALIVFLSAYLRTLHQ